MSINSVNYPGFYAPVFVENHSNPEADAIVKKVNDEIKVVQADQKVHFIQNVLKGRDLTKPQRIALEYMLRDAQCEFAQLKNEALQKYGRC